MADNCIESQKEIINSLQSAWLSNIESATRLFTTKWVSPRNVADSYAKVVSNIADNTVTATKLLNNAIFANLEAYKKSIQDARDTTSRE